MKNNYQIRSLELNDWTQFRLLRLEALQQHPEAFGASLEEEFLLTDEMFREGYSKSEIFGAFSKDNETLVGCAGFFIYSSLKMQHRGCLFSMYTKEDYRNQGIADALIKKVIEHAKKRVIQLHLTVVTTNKAAIRLYEKNGFRIYGTEPQSLKISDQFYDEHFMVIAFS